MKNTIEKIKTDLVQSKLIDESDDLCYIKLSYLFLTSQTTRIITFVRLSQSKFKAISALSRHFLRKKLINIGDIKLGNYFLMPHPQSIIIASNVKIGNHVHVGQNVTIGGNFKKYKVLNDGSIQKLPIIGDRVMIHPGAVIGGPVTIGNDVIIGANSVVTKDVPPNTIAYGQNCISKKKIVIPSSGGEYEILN
jgi:serine acetyltransferase